jgi:hypothetical protein
MDPAASRFGHVGAGETREAMPSAKEVRPRLGVDDVCGEEPVVDDPVFEICCEPFLLLGVQRAAQQQGAAEPDELAGVVSHRWAHGLTYTRATAHAGVAPVLAAKSCSPTRLGRCVRISPVRARSDVRRASSGAADSTARSSVNAWS